MLIVDRLYDLSFAAKKPKMMSFISFSFLEVRLLVREEIARRD